MYNTLIFQPLYNLLVGIIDAVPGIDVGIAVIIFTIMVRFILFPLSKSALLTQVRMKQAEPEINKIKAQYAADKQVQALKVMEYYRTNKIKPFSSILLLFVQIPILFALLSVFYKIIPDVQPQYLYSFISVPHIKASLLGLSLIDKSLILSIITAVIQYLQLHYSLASRQHREHVAKYGLGNDMQSQMAHSMNNQMKYFVPILAFASTYWLIPVKYPQAAAIIAIYWSVSALFTLLQELYIRKKYLETAN